MTKHKHDLEKLKQTDPEFYEFMQKEDKQLLEFSDEEEESEAELEVLNKVRKKRIISIGFR